MSAPRFLAITPPASAGAPNVACLDVWRATGIDTRGLAILLRDPGRRPAAFFGTGSPYRPLIDEARARGLELIVSADPETLEETQSLDVAVHLRGTPQALGSKQLGRSAHVDDLDHPGRCALPARYWTFAPVFPPSSVGKRAVGLDALRRACELLMAPVLALGGVHADQAALCIQAGAHGIAGITSFFGPTGRVERDTRACVEALGSLS